MTKQLTIVHKKIATRLIITIVPVIIIFLFVCVPFLDVSFFTSENYKDIQFDLLTISSILTGFLFTSLSIFISISEHDHIKKQAGFIQFAIMIWTIIAGLICIVIALLSSILILIINPTMVKSFLTFIVECELFFLVTGTILFIISIHDSIWVVKEIRKNSHTLSDDQLKATQKYISGKK